MENLKCQLVSGLKVQLDRLVYEYNEENLPQDTPHAFIYFLTIANLADRAVTLLGRKWVIHDSNGVLSIIEGDGIVGKSPLLKPGESFSYNSYHVTGSSAQATGAFYGIDEFDNPIHTTIPPFEMSVPSRY